MAPSVSAQAFKAERKAWKDIQRRCNSPSCRDYRNYGARGIQCLFPSFEDFLADAGPRPAQGYSINRINNEKHYEPGNVRWDDKTAQNRNRRNNHVITYNGESFCIAEWAERLGIHQSTLRSRILDGWAVERAFTPPN
jgi:hypothetical protein